MAKPKWWIAACSLFTIIVGCSPAREPLDRKATTDEDVAAVTKLRNEYVLTWKAANADHLASLYADDGIVLYPNHAAVVGRSAILAYFKNFYEQFTPVNFELSSNEVTADATWAFDRGTYKLSIAPKIGGTAIQDYGKYLVILQRQLDGSWKVARDMDNSSAELSPSPPPNKQKP